mgnify:CR=1 FL=1
MNSSTIELKDSMTMNKSYLQWTFNCTNCGDVLSGEMEELDWIEVYHLYDNFTLEENNLIIYDECDECIKEKL